jgi:ATP-dependent Clp protease ATP-binding subunit ClpX
VKKLVAGPDVWICDECIGLCNDILADEPAAPQKGVPAVSELIAGLEAEIVGQPIACRTVAAALWRHLSGRRGPAPHGPARVLLVGPRGCGKTALARALCRVAGIPAYHADSSRMSETGYIGENVENLVGALLDRAADVEEARRGVLVLDGLHHLVRQTPFPLTRDVAGREVQRDLVRLLDGLELGAVRNAKRHPQATTEPVACDRLLFVALGTFDVEVADEDALRTQLAERGLVDELLARFDVIVPMRRLSARDLEAIAARQLASVRTFVETLGGTVEPADGLRLLAERAAATPDGAFALVPPLVRLRERAVLEGPRRWTLDAGLARELLSVRG